MENMSKFFIQREIERQLEENKKRVDAMDYFADCWFRKGPKLEKRVKELEEELRKEKEKPWLSRFYSLFGWPSRAGLLAVFARLSALQASALRCARDKAPRGYQRPDRTDQVDHRQ